ncbi:NUDIX hydrolase [Streptomyces sp. NPDC015220]|uniref:NUDIX hydrolase n=1 Tax=Streptomyces sp. NPDC015220 TaxID=3364947 RepID=UPI0036FB2462
MKLDFLPPGALTDGVLHQYCLRCHSDQVEWRTDGGRRHAVCRSCGSDAERALVLDPSVRWWTDAEGEYWHETAGVFLCDARGRLLFFDRTAFPFGLTVPAGHVEPQESPGEAAARELEEETGIVCGGLEHVARTPIPGDGCRRGADAHLWHVYRSADAVEADTAVELGPEGTTAVWLTPDEALDRPLTYAVKHLLAHYKDVFTAS